MVRIGIITDIHIAPAGEPDGAWHNAYSFPDAAARFQRALQLLQHEGADAIAILGDVVNNGDDASLDGGIALAAAAPAPLYLVGGNHDLPSGEDALARAISRAGAGASHLHLLDGTGQPLGDGLRLAGIQPRPGRPPYGMRAGEVTTAPWGGDVVILISHFPVFSLKVRADAAGMKYAGDLDDGEDVARRVLARPAPTIVIHGHLHIGHAEAQGTALQISCPALIEPPFAVTILDLTRDGAQLLALHRTLPVAPVPDVPLPLLSPPEQSWRFQDGAWRRESAAGSGGS